MISDDIKDLHNLAEDVLLKWLDNPPTNRRELKALELLADAGQLLNSACINMTAFKTEPQNINRTDE